MKKILKFIAILIITNIRKIIIIGGILMISSFSYYGAINENGERVISFEENATQSASAFESESTEEKQQEIKQEEQQEKQQEIKIAKEENVTPKKEETKEEKKDITMQKLSDTSENKKTQEKVEVVKEQKAETIQQENKQQEVVEENKQEIIIIEKAVCIDNKHKIEVGNSNKWFDSQQDAIAEYKKELNVWSQKAKNGAIEYDELYQKCPYGYETWSCSNCGKWTLNYYYH